MVRNDKMSPLFSDDARLPSWLSRHMTLDQAREVEHSITQAEKNTSGEIVPVIVRRSVGLTPPSMQLSLIFALIFLLAAYRFVGDWFDYRDILIVAAGTIASALAGRLVSRNPVVHRILTPDKDAALLAVHRAELEFHRARIGSTEGNTGILLFLSIEDHEAVVLADKSISDLLPANTWDEILMLMIEGLKKNQCSDGLKRAIIQCGEILGKHFPISSNDVNELANHLIIKD